MNEHYVSIKVDREERPDVDAIYMTAVQALTGSGGWPMSVWLTPEREPFFGGTYFPPRDGARGARHGFLDHAARHARTRTTRDPARVGRAPAALVDAVREPHGGGGGRRRARRAGRPAASLIADTRHGLQARCSTTATAALRRAPKFPSNMPIRLLLRAHAPHRRRRGAADGGG